MIRLVYFTCLIWVLASFQVQGQSPRISASFRAVGQIFVGTPEMSYVQIAFDENYEHGTEKNSLTLTEAGVKVTILEYVRLRQAFQYDDSGACSSLATKDIDMGDLDIQVVKLDKSGQYVFPIRQLLFLPDKYLIKQTSEDSTFMDIPANMWVYYIKDEKYANVTIRVEAYWSTADINTPSVSREIPLGFLIKRNVMDSVTKKWSSVVQRLDVQLFTKGDFYFKAFRPRRGIFCPNRTDPELFPSLDKMGIHTLHAKMEVVLKDSDRDLTVDVFFDPQSKLYRIDFIPITEVLDLQELRQIFSHTQGLVYEMKGSRGDCEVRKVTDLAFDPETIFDPRDSKRFTIEDLMGTSATNYNAVGETVERGIPCVLYHGLRQDWPSGEEGKITTLWEWCIANTKLDIVTFPKDGIPFVSLNIYVTESPHSVLDSPYFKDMKFTYNFYDVKNFTKGYMEQLAFDVQSCFADDNRRKLIFIAEVPIESKSLVTKNVLSLELLSAWRSAILEAAKVQPGSLRLSNLQTRIQGNDLEVTLTLLGRHPDLPIDSSEIPLKEAVNNIKTSLDAGKMEVSVQLGPNDDIKNLKIKAKPGSLKVLLEDLTPITPDNDSESGVTAGAMAGMAIGMLVLGVAVGAAIVFYLKWKNHATLS